MRRRFVNGVAASAVALAVALGGGLGGVVFAAPETGGAVVQEVGRRGGKQAEGAALLVQSTAEVTGLSRGQIAEQLRAGKSLEQIATESGKTAQEIIVAARAKLDTRLRQAVAAGRITQTRADALIQRFDREAPATMADTALGERMGSGRGRGVLIETTAAVTGLTPEQVRAELAAGKSLAQIAQERGKTVDDILAQLRARAQERMDTALEQARERISAPGLSE